MKKRMKKLASLLLSVSMTFSMISFPVYATPADNTENETAVTTESPETEEPADAAGETTEPVAEEQETTQPETTNPDTTEPEAQQEEEQPTVTPIEENFTGYTVHAEDIDVSGVTPYSVPVDEENAVEVDENDPVTSTIEEELNGMTVLSEEGESVALTEEQIRQILYMWQQYQDQCKANANLLGVQQPFFLSYNDNKEDGLGVLGEMLVLAGYTVDQVRSGAYSFDDLMGMIQNFYYADKFGIKYYAGAIAEKRDEAIQEVKESGAKTMAQKLLVLNDWIAHQATFDMGYIMKGDTDGDGEKDDPLMVAEKPQKHEHYDEIYNEMYKVYEDQIRQQFRDKIAAGIKDAVYQQALKQAQAAHDDIYNQIYQSLLNNGMEDNDETKALAEEKTQEQIEQIAQNAVDDVVKNGMPATDEEGNPITDEEGNQVKVPFEKVIDNQMDQPLDDLGGMTPNEAIPVYAQQAAEGLTQGILGAWEGNHIGILAEGKGVCAGYSKAFSYIVQYMSPEYYGKDGAGTDMSVSENWKTPDKLYYTTDADGNKTLDINKDYIVDMVRITYDANTTMFGEESPFGEVHFWNAVKVDGKWYYVDPCYADIYVECMNRDRVEIDGTMNHMYFLFSDSTARELYDGNMKEIATLYNDAATDTSYEDSWFARISSNAYSDGKNFYYLYDSTDQLSMMREFGNMQGSEGSQDFDESDFEALMAGSDPDYKIVYHPITDKDINEEKDADSDFTTLIDFNPKDEDDNTLSAQVYDPEEGKMVDNELLTYLFAKYKEECDIYPSIMLTAAMYDGKIYFNLSNCILSYELSSGAVSIVKEYDKVSGKRDNTNPFGGMAFTTCSEGEAAFTFTNRPIAAMTIKEDGHMYVSIATNLGFISGKESVNDISSYGYEYEESNYNPNYSDYTQDSDYSDEQLAEMGYSKETNDNDEFMWSAVFVDTFAMGTTCDHNYETVTETFCGRDGYTEKRCTKCGAVEDGSRVVNEGTACDHHYVHFNEQYYTKDGNGNWNSGDCYVCTVCGFAIEEPTEPTKNAQETDEEYAERQAEYEEEKAIYDHAVETAGHTYEATNADNVTWGEDNMTASVSGDVHCAVCEGRKLDALGANAYDPKASDNADNKVLSATLDSDVGLTVEEDAKTVSGKCDSGLTINYTATGTTDDGKKIVAKKTETTKAGRHDYEATWTWAEVDKSEGEESEETEAQSEDTQTPYKATAKIKCSACEDAPEEELEGYVELDKEKSAAATCEEAGKNVYKATASYTKAEGEEPYTFETSDDDLKVDEIPATGHKYDDGKWSWSETETGYTPTLVLTCQNDANEAPVTLVEGDGENDIKVEVDDSKSTATCTEAGKIVYNASVTYEGKEYKDSKETEVPALGHDYQAVFTWTDKDDYTATATAVFTCTHDESHKLEGEVDVQKDDKASKAATCTEDGKNVYTATATVTDEEGKVVATATTEKPHEVVIPKTGHKYDDGKWSWSETENGYTPTLVLTCQNDANEAPVTLAEGDGENDIKVEVDDSKSTATCTEAGKIVYNASVTYEGKEYKDSKETEVPALGHDYQAVFTWTDKDDYTATATAVFTCTHDESHKLEGDKVKVAVDKDQNASKAATCTEDGKNVYTATATVTDEEGKVVATATTEKPHEVVIPKTGHKYDDGKWSWSETETGYTPTLVLTCQNDANEAPVTLVEGDGENDIKVEVDDSKSTATCTEAGKIVYNASVTYEGKEYKDSKETEVPALGHDYQAVFTWTDKDDYTATATAVFTCTHDESHKLEGEVDVQKDDKASKAATCTEDGKNVYTATATVTDEEGKVVATATTEKPHEVVIPKTGHKYDDGKWSWSETETGYTPTLVLTCQNDANEAPVTLVEGDGENDIKVEVDDSKSTATCTEAGKIVYNASVTYEGKEYNDSKETEVPALGHDYQAVFTWTDKDDYTATATAVFTCTHDESHKLEGEVDVQKDDKASKAATCTEDGKNVYTATATVTDEEGKVVATATTEKPHEVVIPKTGHKYDDGKWSWSETETGYTPTLVLTCQNDANEAPVTLVEGDGENDIKVEVDDSKSTATCTEAGKIVYNASVTYEGKEYKDSKETEVPALGHDYQAVFTWTDKDDYTATATAVFTCTHDESHKLEGEVDVQKDDKASKAATCTEDGKNVYTATATVTDEEGKVVETATTEKPHEVVIPKTGHKYDDGKWSWSETETGYTPTLVLTCQNDANEAPVTLVEGDGENDIKVEVDDSKSTATCTEAGKIVYNASVTYEGKEYKDSKVADVPALGHNYKAEFTWVENEADHTATATAVFTCQNDATHKLEGDAVEVKVVKVEEESTEPTCIYSGKNVFKATATATDADGKVYTADETREVKIPATGHTYADDEEHAIWTWTKAEGESETAYVATLVLKCTTCGTVTDPMDADVTVQTTNATCTEAGTATYTAKVTHDDVEYTDVKEVTGEALGHSYQATWKWEAVEGAVIPFKATADLVCSRCEDKVEGLEAEVTQKSHKDATCTVDGETVYEANLTYENKDYNTEKAVTIKATGHEWSEWVTVEKPTETTAGKEERTCSKCGEKEYKTIAMLSAPSVVYRTHVQDFGWQAEQSDGATAGTSGLSKRLEAIEIKLAANNSYTGSIEYRTHVQNIGWQDYVADGATAGTSKQSLRLEAIQIKLTGEIANYYHVYYRVHAQDYGWLDWASDDQVAGTYGLGKRLEAIEIKLVRDGDPAPGETDKPYVYRNVLYRTHVQDYGWQDAKVNGESSGTTGKSKRLEAITIGLQNQEYSGDIIYTTHIQDIGWQDKTEAAWKKNGAISGTSGQSKRLEAIKIKLTGEMAEHYDVYYRVHAQNFGWMGWAKNGQSAGTAGYSYRLEAIQIQLVPKGEAAPVSTNNAFRQKK